MAEAPSDAPLLETPLADLHRGLNARMVPFAGYAMPVQYPSGILTEHNWTRSAAGLFDVSHMGQAMLVADDGRHDTVARALEALVPADILNLRPGAQRYTQFTAADGGILDDLMVSRPAGSRRTAACSSSSMPAARMPTMPILNSICRRVCGWRFWPTARDRACRGRRPKAYLPPMCRTRRP